VEGHRRTIEDSFEAARNEPGLDHDETRRIATHLARARIEPSYIIA